MFHIKSRMFIPYPIQYANIFFYLNVAVSQLQYFKNSSSTVDWTFDLLAFLHFL
jgi:hypothetical protein